MSDFIIGYIMFLLTPRRLRDAPGGQPRDVNVVNVTYIFPINDKKNPADRLPV